MQWGRSDHMEIFSWETLGCLLSHMAIWETVRPNEIVLVLEEDAELSDVSGIRLSELTNDMRGLRWDLLMLTAGSAGLRGGWKQVGKLAATCVAKDCSWQGTLGYMVTERGAKLLHSYARPFHVQSDALMGLVAAYVPEFYMYWTRYDIALQKTGHISSLWKSCIKCYVPAGRMSFGALFWVVGCLVGILGVFAYTMENKKTVLK
jgi:GR25 family glycosyltransferase involved in LPS biosynthesis